MLTLIEGPAGGGKSQVAADLLDAGEIEVLADITALWVALSGAVRGPDGRYPERGEDEPALSVAQYLQAVAVRYALEAGYSVGATTSRRGQVERWRQLAVAAGRNFAVRTVDPGLAVVTARLAGPDGELSEACRQAIGRWYLELRN